MTNGTLATKVENNRLEGNLFFPTQYYPTYGLNGHFANNDFGSYDLNRYSSVYSKGLVEETYKPGGILTSPVYTTLSRWQKERNLQYFPFLEVGQRVPAGCLPVCFTHSQPRWCDCPRYGLSPNFPTCGRFALVEKKPEQEWCPVAEADAGVPTPSKRLPMWSQTMNLTVSDHGG